MKAGGRRPMNFKGLEGGYQSHFSTRSNHISNYSIPTPEFRTNHGFTQTSYFVPHPQNYGF